MHKNQSLGLSTLFLQVSFLIKNFLINFDEKCSFFIINFPMKGHKQMLEIKFSNPAIDVIYFIVMLNKDWVSGIEQSEI